MSDHMETVGRSILQHGKENNRIYLMKLKDKNPQLVIDYMDRLVGVEGYTKIFAKVPASAAPAFLESGYGEEARVTHLFNGTEDGCFLSRFYDDKRAVCSQPEVEQILESVRKKKPLKKLNPLPESITLRPAGPKDVHAMAVLYREVFESYPFPIHDPGYLRETMESHVDYFVAETTDGLVGISSAEKDVENSNVEMTDFAVHPSARGHGLAMHLLKQMEAAMREQQIQTAFTIARAGEGGMNATFARLGYHFGGQLVNNTQICGRLETMNVWHKSL